MSRDLLTFRAKYKTFSLTALNLASHTWGHTANTCFPFHTCAQCTHTHTLKTPISEGIFLTGWQEGRSLMFF